mgnify:CR=1 FL=1
MKLILVDSSRAKAKPPKFKFKLTHELIAVAFWYKKISGHNVDKELYRMIKNLDKRELKRISNLVNYDLHVEFYNILYRNVEKYLSIKCKIKQTEESGLGKNE